MPKKLIDRYTPGIIPDTPAGLIQFLYDELPRIQAALNPFAAGVGVSESALAVPIGQPGALYPLFVGQAPNYDVPGGYWDAATGTWPVPEAGLYSIDLICQVQGLAAPGAQDYVVNLNLEVDGVIVYTASNTGNDEFPLSCAISYTGYVERDSTISGSVVLDHDSKTGTVPAEFNMSVALAGFV